MTTRQAIRHFGTPRELGAALGISVQAIYQWGAAPPLMRQYQIERLTGGKLKAKEARQ